MARTLVLLATGKVIKIQVKVNKVCKHCQEIKTSKVKNKKKRLKVTLSRTGKIMGEIPI